MSTLALDLGTETGWAWWCANNPTIVLSGVWDFNTKRMQGAGMKYEHFKDRLTETLLRFEPKRIFFEEIRRHLGTTAAHVHGGFKAHLEAWCEVHHIPYEGVPVGEIKRFWAGHGNATKEQMIDEAVRRGFKPQDDNEADALAILHLKGGLII